MQANRKEETDLIRAVAAAAGKGRRNSQLARSLLWLLGLQTLLKISFPFFLLSLSLAAD
jgi:hypothetical protein